MESKGRRGSSSSLTNQCCGLNNGGDPEVWKSCTSNQNEGVSAQILQDTLGSLCPWRLKPCLQLSVGLGVMVRTIPMPLSLKANILKAPGGREGSTSTPQSFPNALFPATLLLSSLQLSHP